jgi:hypothetical protein
MIKEKNPLLNLKIVKDKSPFLDFYNNNVEILFELFDLLLDNPFENIWFEFFKIFFGYIQLIAFGFDPSVSN